MDKAQLTEPLRFLNLIGLDPCKSDRFSTQRKFLAICIPLTVAICAALEVLLNFQGLETCSRASESMIVFYQITHKIAVLIIYKKEIVQLVEDASSFWELNRFDGKFTKPVQIHSLSRKFFLVYKIMMLIMSLQYVLSKLFYNTDKPLAICYGESTGLTPLQDKLYYVLHSASTFEILFLILGFDGLFFYFVAHALAELKMVKVSFYHDRIDNFFVTIEHHVFVLKFIHKLNQVYSKLLLNQHISCLFGICFGLFLLSKDGIPPDFAHITKFLPYITVFVVQTFTFCFVGSLITDWDAVFYTDWSRDEAYQYKTDKILAINRAQTPAKLTLGGFTNLDLLSFTVVVKNAFSFFTFMNSMTQE